MFDEDREQTDLGVSPAPDAGDEPETTQPGDPDAGGDTGDTPPQQPEPAAPALSPWDSLKRDYPWAHEELMATREQNRRLKSGEVDIGPRGRAPAAEDKSLVDRIVEKYADAYRDAELADDPALERAKLNAKVAAEIAQAEARGAVGRVSPSTNASVLSQFKQEKKADARIAPFWARAEQHFNRLVRQVEDESRAAGEPLVLSPEFLEPLFKLAIGDVITGTVASPAETTRAGATAAARTAIAPGNTATTREQPAQLSDDEHGILGALARGAGADEKTVKTGYAQRKRGER